MKRTLVIMAAGLGSRYGGGIKQLAPVGMHGEIIMDYSIHDAIRAGFTKVVFIIRRDIKAAFREAIGNRIEAVCRRLNVEVCYAYQSLDDIPEGCLLPEGRTKPWGTGQAVLACKDLIHEPFAVINADDYYGQAAFQDIYNFFADYTPEAAHRFCMAGFILENTLSKNGSVTRGVCRTNESGRLTYIRETKHIRIAENGDIVAGDELLQPGTPVSMNMWGLTPEFISMLEEGFARFFADPETDPATAEFLLPVFIGKRLEQNSIDVQVLRTHDKWFGLTYQEDLPSVIAAIQDMTQRGVYSEDLFSDL